MNIQETELVAVGAAVGAGCVPCLEHHLRVAKNAGLAEAPLAAAVADAQQLKEDALRRFAAATGAGAAYVETPAPTGLAALGAAIGSNSQPNIERLLADAARSGYTSEQLAQAARVAYGVQQGAAGKHREVIERIVGPLEDGAPAGCGDGCGCNDEPQ